MKSYYSNYNHLIYLTEEIQRYTHEMRLCKCTFQKLFYNYLILNNLNQITQLLYSDFILSIKSRKVNNVTMKEFTLNELAKFNGSSGNPAYVAVNGIVYDVSLSPPWGGGTHYGLISGKDLSNEFTKCHKQMSILNSLPKVGKLKR